MPRELLADIQARFAALSQAVLLPLVQQLWQLPDREYRYD